VFTQWEGGLGGSANPSTAPINHEQFVQADFNTIPTALAITSLSPTSVNAGSAPFTLTINGTGFTPPSAGAYAYVVYNGVLLNRTLTYISPTRLQIPILATDVVNPGGIEILVENFNATGCWVPATAQFVVSTNQVAVGPPPYLVGDVFPFAGHTNGTFGDGQVNTLDLLATLRAVTGIPGSVPTACSDRFDAMDAFPVDTTLQPGGDGVLNTLDLLETLRRVANTDASRPTRMSRGQVCSSPSPQTVRSPTSPQGALELVGDDVRTAIHLNVYQNDLSLRGLSLSVGLDSGADDSPLEFVSAGQPPSLTDTGLPGKLALAWLDGWTAKAGDRVLLGHVQSQAKAITPTDLVFFGASANAASTGQDVPLNLGRAKQR
jgi:hypothetical protein